MSDLKKSKNLPEKIPSEKCGDALQSGRESLTDLCVDEGCPHHGTPHFCIDQRLRHQEDRAEQVVRSHEGYDHEDEYPEDRDE